MNEGITILFISLKPGIIICNSMSVWEYDRKIEFPRSQSEERVEIGLPWIKNVSFQWTIDKSHF